MADTRIRWYGMVSKTGAGFRLHLHDVGEQPPDQVAAALLAEVRRLLPEASTPQTTTADAALISES
ncbi:hypothetical protein [Micromonospora schwarzwaldensis]|uniref:hypothetical protein n=1 Tax=Micromonospora sp. DSM 45708 TaxID=3111767 RepID=UPI0031DF71BF